MFGLSYAMAHHFHVRVDVSSHQLPSKFVKMIEIVGILILMIPFLIIVIDHGSRFTYEVLSKSLY